MEKVKRLSSVSEKYRTKGITFEEFETFCHLLNNLEDFTVATKYIAYANKRPLSPEEFKRAADACLNAGEELSQNVVATILTVFGECPDEEAGMLATFINNNIVQKHFCCWKIIA